MAILYDAQGNEQTINEDILGGVVQLETRSRVGTLGALNSEVLTTVNGQQTLTADLRSSAFSGTIVVEGTIDGTNYWGIPFALDQTQNYQAALTVTGATSWIIKANVGGYALVRIRCSSFTSGVMNVAARVGVADMKSSLMQPHPTLLFISAQSTANSAVTATLPAPTGNMFHYITHINISRSATAALTGTATLNYTTSNLPGTLTWTAGNAMVAGGTAIDVAIDFPYPLKSSTATTATTIAAGAAGAAVLTRINVGYYLGF